MTFRFKCISCDQVHEGMPSFGASAPLSYYEILEAERPSRCDLGSDDCVIDGKHFFVRGCIDIPVHGQDESFSWGVWVSLSEASHLQWIKYFDEKKRAHIGPFFGWLNAWLKPYPDTVNLKTKVHFRDDGVRPCIELEPTDQPLAVEQREGISVERVAEIYALMVHNNDA
ncbi:DUF2199 domain-containing protein [Acidovorax delafieldii]|uniref:DUF2199 domain-containing protein n=1 Tax=Acidovorax delafieldii TaxID=47920 RepID=UPI003ECDFF60